VHYWRQIKSCYFKRVDLKIIIPCMS